MRFQKISHLSEFLFILFAFFLISSKQAIVLSQQSNTQICSLVCSNEQSCILMDNAAICTVVCGDGIVAKSQDCDDGDSDEKNGCTNSCRVNQNWVCIKYQEGGKYKSECYYNPIVKCTKYIITSDSKIKCETCEIGEELSSDKTKCMLTIPGCTKLIQQKSYYNSSLCSACAPGYQVSDTSDKCIFKIPGCLWFNHPRSNFTLTICSQCDSGYRLAEGGKKCIPTMTGCLIYNQVKSKHNRAYCAACVADQYQYSKTQQKCMVLIKGCIKYDQYNSNSTKSYCKTCNKSLVLSSNKDKCMKQINACSFYIQAKSSYLQSSCGQCSGNGTEDPNLFLLKINECSEYQKTSTKTNTLCKLCYDTFWISSDMKKCMMLIPGCKSYDETISTTLASKCLACEDKFIVSTNKNKCIVKISNCLAYDQDQSSNVSSLCTSCQSPYQVSTAQRECITIAQIQGCLRYDQTNNNICKQCNSPYQLSANFDKCMLLIAGCLTYDQVASSYSSSICTACSNNNKLSSLKNKCMMPIQQCNSYNEQISTSTISQCSVCNYGYQPSTLKDKCIIKIANCLVYDQTKSNDLTSVCTSCSETYQQIQDKNRCLLKIASCLVYDTVKSTDAVSYCAACDTKWQLSDLKDKCILKIDGCAVYDQSKSSSASSVCSSCSTNLNPSISKDKCMLNIQKCAIYDEPVSNSAKSVCELCESGYQASTDGSKCVLVIAGCSSYNQQISTSLSSICLACSSNLLVSSASNKCILTIPQCSKYDQSKSTNVLSYCSSCSSTNYILTDLKDKCILKIDACKTYNQASSSSTVSLCSQCQSPQRLIANSTKCIISILNCQTYNEQLSTYQSSLCSTCNAGYLVSQNSSLCYKQIPKCIQYSITLNTCLRCKPGYFLGTGNLTCLSYSTLYCKTKDISSGNCSVVNAGFVKSDDGLSYVYKNVKGCFKYNKTNGICLQCLPGYSATGNPIVCTSLLPDNRRQYYRPNGILAIIQYDSSFSNTNWLPSSNRNDLVSLAKDQLYENIWPFLPRNFCVYNVPWLTKYYCSFQYNILYNKYKIIKHNCSSQSLYQIIQQSSSCQKFMIANKIDLRFCNKIDYINNVCIQCQKDYKLNIRGVCIWNNTSFKFQIYTPLGNIRVLNFTTQIPKGWRVLALDEVLVIKNNLQSNLETYGIYLFNSGTLYGSNNSLTATINNLYADFYIIKMDQGEVLNCQFYYPGIVSLCYKCRIGYQLSADKLACSPNLISDCQIYHPILENSCSASNSEILQYNYEKQKAQNNSIMIRKT